MSKFSIGPARTLVAIASTLVCGSSLMMAALGPGLAQAQTPTPPVAATPQA